MCKLVLVCSRLSSRSVMGGSVRSKRIYSLGTKNHTRCVLVFHTPDQFRNTEVRNASCAPRGAFCSISPLSYTLFTLTNTEGSVFFHAPSTAGMGREVQVTGKVQFKSSPSEKQHLQMSLLLWSFLLATHPLPYTLDAVYLLALVESLAVALIKKQHKCNKQETGVLSVYLYFPPTSNLASKPPITACCT